MYSNRQCRLMVLFPSVFLLANVAHAQDGLIAHWKLAGDVQDSSENKQHAVNRGADLEVTGPNGVSRKAAAFDGRRSFLEVPNSRSLDVGTGDFSILVWVHTTEKTDDVPGDIISKYDPKTRTGFRLGSTAAPALRRVRRIGAISISASTTVVAKLSGPITGGWARPY